MVKNNRHPDYGLLISAALIILAGFVIFVSVSMARMAIIEEGVDQVNLNYFLFRQFVFGVLPGIVLGFVAYNTPLEKLRKFAPALLFLSIVLVLLVFVPGVGRTMRGATRWIGIGSFSFQPTEFLKLTFILYLASWLSGRKREKKKRIFSETLIAFLIFSGFIGGLILLQPDLSTLLVIILTGFVMYFVYGNPLSHIFVIGLGGTLSLVLAVVLTPYRMQRVRDLISSGMDPQGLSYQAQQALIAIGSGGIFGLGFGMGYRKYGYIPLVMSDSIFAAYAEEAGFIGSLVLIGLFLVFAWRGVKIAKESTDPFLGLVATGITFWIFFQAFVNIGSMVGVVPMTGIPLPLISHGRAHFISELAALGILLNISRS